jgi:hypothetical protein
MVSVRSALSDVVFSQADMALLASADAVSSSALNIAHAPPETAATTPSFAVTSMLIWLPNV